MIREAWFSVNDVGSAMLRLSKKLKAIKNPIREFSKHNYSDRLSKQYPLCAKSLKSCSGVGSSENMDHFTQS